MALSIRNAELETKARRLAKGRGTTVTGVLLQALNNEIAREEKSRDKESETVLTFISDLQARMRALPELDGRSADDIIGYDEDGLPT